MKIDNKDTYFDDSVAVDLRKLLQEGKKQAETFWNDRLVKRLIPIDAPIKKNNFFIPGRYEDQKVDKEQKLVYSNTALTKLRVATEVRPEIASKVFESELYGVAQSLAQTTRKLYHGNKAVILEKFESCKFVEVAPLQASAVVIELSPLLRTQNFNSGMTFKDLAKALYDRIMVLAKGYQRCDVVADRYFQQSLKGGLRDDRGSGTRIIFDENTVVPNDLCANFLMNSENKSDLGYFLAEQFMDLHQSIASPTLICTYGDSVLAENLDILQDDVKYCKSEEADQRMIRHVISCAKNGYNRVDVKTVDTDVLMLMISVYPVIRTHCPLLSLYCCHGLGKSQQFYNIVRIATELCNDICMTLPFFYAFSGCDTVSSFYGISKSKLWNRWMESANQKLFTNLFKKLSDQPDKISNLDLDILELFLIEVYYPNTSVVSLNEERKDHFLRMADMNIRNLPVSRSALLEHAKRACLQAGWIWREAICNVDTQDPSKWGWSVEEGSLFPKWQDVKGDSLDINTFTQVCGCKKAICKKCKCSADGMACLPFCGCRQKCKNNKE